MIILDRTIDEIKTKMLAKSYRAYVYGKIKWEQFCEVTEVIDRLFISDIALLYKIENGQVKDTSNCAIYQADRLISLGLVDSAMKSMFIANNNNSRTEKYISINEFGNIFCKVTR